MPQVSIEEAKTHLPRLIDVALRGEDVIITRRNQPLVRLSVIGGDKKRQSGSCPKLILQMSEGLNDELRDLESPVFPDVKPPRE